MTLPFSHATNRSRGLSGRVSGAADRPRRVRFRPHIRARHSHRRSHRRSRPAWGTRDHALTPGASVSTDPAVVCAPGYSRSVRPPSQYTDALKDRQLAAGYPGTTGLSSRDVEEDPLLMLALGGDPRNPQNLWPEPRHVRAADGQDAGADTKDLFESYLYTQVCRQHALTVPQAQQQLTTDWYAAYVAAGRPHGSGTSS